jgi:protein-L-isoaspartate(D-aspartate) O-methyltransferase
MVNRWKNLIPGWHEVLVLSVTALLALGCSSRSSDVPADDQIAGGGESLLAETNFDRQRAAMVTRQLRGRDISDPLVLAAMQNVLRHEFVPENLRSAAYKDGPLPIGNGQTISQPYIVALMTQLAHIGPDSKVLDVGTGSGYQAAVLAEIVNHVYSIEIVETLADQARERLKRLGYENIEVRSGDGYLGWPEQAPFDAIVVAAAPDHVPQPLVDQLAPGGHLIIPVGKFFQTLIVVEKHADGSIEKTNVAPVAFVPMTGQAQQNH